MIKNSCNKKVQLIKPFNVLFFLRIWRQRWIVVMLSYVGRLFKRFESELLIFSVQAELTKCLRSINNVQFFSIYRSTILVERRRSNMDPVHVRRPRTSCHRQRPLPDERQSPLSHDHRDVLSESSTRRQNALQRFPTPTFNGDVQLNNMFVTRLRTTSSFFLRLVATTYFPQCRRLANSCDLERIPQQHLDQSHLRLQKLATCTKLFVEIKL